MVSPVVKRKPAKKKPRGKPFPKKTLLHASPAAGQTLENDGLNVNSPLRASVMRAEVAEVLPTDTQLSPRSLQASKRVQVLQVLDR